MNDAPSKETLRKIRVLLFDEIIENLQYALQIFFTTTWTTVTAAQKIASFPRGRPISDFQN